MKTLHRERQRIAHTLVGRDAQRSELSRAARRGQPISSISLLVTTPERWNDDEHHSRDMNLTHTGLPTSAFSPVGFSAPVLGSIRKTRMLSPS